MLSLSLIVKVTICNGPECVIKLDVFTDCPAKQWCATINKNVNGAPHDIAQRLYQCIFTVIMSCDFIHVHKKSTAFCGPIKKTHWSSRGVLHTCYIGKCGQYGYKVWWIFPDVLKGHNAFVLASWSLNTSGNIHLSHKTYTAVRTTKPLSLFIPTCMITHYGRWLHVVIHCYLLPLCKCTEIWSP